jgi:hypothetical protein
MRPSNMKRFPTPDLDQLFLNTVDEDCSIKRCYHSHLRHLHGLDFARIIKCSEFKGESGSSVSIVSGYGLDVRAIDIRSLAEAK